MPFDIKFPYMVDVYVLENSPKVFLNWLIVKIFLEHIGEFIISFEPALWHKKVKNCKDWYKYTRDE